MGKRLTTEEFISRSKSVWGEDMYDYSKCFYVNSERKVVLICKKHNIEFSQNPYNHIKYKCNGCYKCVEENSKQHKSGYWTYERCYEEAQKYKILKEFYKESFSAYEKSLNNKWLSKFTWLGRIVDTSILESNGYTVYKYVFREFNSVYIGLTIDLEQRHKTHCKKGAVYAFCKRYKIELPKPIIVEKELTLQEVKDREQYWIQYHKENGYNLLNKTKGGDSLGSLGVSFKQTTEEYIAKAKQVHGNRYSYSQTEYLGSKVKVGIVCSKHGLFQQMPYDHLQGKGCPKCGREKTGKIRTEWK